MVNNMYGVPSPIRFKWNRVLPATLNEALTQDAILAKIMCTLNKLIDCQYLSVPYLIATEVASTTENITIKGYIYQDYEKKEINKTFITTGMPDGTYYINVYNDSKDNWKFGKNDPNNDDVFLMTDYMPDNCTTLYTFDIKNGNIDSESIMYNDLYTGMHNDDINAHKQLFDTVDNAIQNAVEAIATEANTRLENDNALDNKIDAHIANSNNPHTVTKEQVGLGSVPNTVPVTSIADSTGNTANNAVTFQGENGITISVDRNTNAVTFTGGGSGSGEITLPSDANLSDYYEQEGLYRTSSVVTNDTNNYSIIYYMTVDKVMQTDGSDTSNAYLVVEYTFTMDKQNANMKLETTKFLHSGGNNIAINEYFVNKLNGKFGEVDLTAGKNIEITSSWLGEKGIIGISTLDQRAVAIANKNGYPEVKTRWNNINQSISLYIKGLTLYADGKSSATFNDSFDNPLVLSNVTVPNVGDTATFPIICQWNSNTNAPDAARLIELSNLQDYDYVFGYVYMVVNDTENPDMYAYLNGFGGSNDRWYYIPCGGVDTVPFTTRGSGSEDGSVAYREITERVQVNGTFAPSGIVSILYEGGKNYINIPGETFIGTLLYTGCLKTVSSNVASGDTVLTLPTWHEFVGSSYLPVYTVNANNTIGGYGYVECDATNVNYGRYVGSTITSGSKVMIPSGNLRVRYKVPTT